MPWLVKEDKVLASVEIARPRRGPLRGAIGEQQITGALMIEPARAAHSLRSNRGIDFAFLGLVHGDGHDGPAATVDLEGNRDQALGAPRGKHAFEKAKTLSRALTSSRSDIDDATHGDEREYRVLRVVALEPNRIIKPELRAVAALEAEAGAFERWGLTEGDTVRIELRQ